MWNHVLGGLQIPQASERTLLRGDMLAHGTYLLMTNLPAQHAANECIRHCEELHNKSAMRPQITLDIRSTSKLWKST